MTKIAAYIDALNAAFDARVAFEASKAKDETSNIAKTLAALRKSATHAKIAGILASADIDAAFINRAIRADVRMNVYAAEKVINVALAIAAADKLNHYTRAILASAASLARHEQALTHDDAKSACTLAIKVKDAKREKMLVKYQKHVAVSTAATQSSSSLDALVMFGILLRSSDEANNTVYKINAENDNAKKLVAQLA